MASYSVISGDRGVHAKVLTANAVDTVTFTDRVPWVEVVSDGTAAIYVTVNGYDATVAGSHTDVLPAGGVTSRVIEVGVRATTVVKLISTGTPAYSVVGLNS